MTRMRFAVINRIGFNFINGHLIPTKRHESPKCYKIEHGIIHHFRIKKPEDINKEFIALLKAAYAVGNQENFKK